jgi:hypothetical protein
MYLEKMPARNSDVRKVDGTERELSRLGPGEISGELALITTDRFDKLYV